MATTPSTSLAEEVKHLQALRRRLKAASTVQPPPSSGRPSSVPVAQTHRTIDGPSVAVLKSDNYPFTLCEEAPASYIPPPVPCDVEGEVERLKATVRLVQDELLAYATGLGKEVSPEAPAHRRLTREEALRFFRECALFSELAWDVSTIQWFYRWVLSHSISHLWSCKEQLEYALTENGQQLPQTVAEMDRCLAELPFPAAVGVLEEDRRVAVEMERQRMHSTSRTYREHVPTLAISDELPTGYLTQEEKYAYQELYNESEHALTMLHHSRKTTKGGASRGSSLGRETSGSLGPTTQLSIVARRLQTEEPEESVLADEAVQALSAESEMIRRLLEDVRIRKTTNTMPDPTFTTDYDKSRRAQIAVYGCVVSDTHLMALQMEAAAEFMEMYEEWLRYHGFENHDALMALLGNDVGEEGMAQWPLPTPSGSPTHAHFIPTREMMNDTPGATSRARNDSEAPLSRNTQHSFGGQPRTPLATARPQTPMEASNARESPAAARPQRATGAAARQPREQQQQQQQQQQPQTSSAPPPPVQRAAAAAQQKEPNTAAGRPMQRDGGAATTKPQKESSPASSARPTPRTAAGAAATQPRDTPLDRPTRQQQPSSTAASQRCATPDNNNNVANKSATELLFTLLQHVAAHWDDHRQDLSTATLSFCWVSAAVRQVALLLLAGTWTSASALSEMNAAERELPRRVGSMGRAKDDGLVPTSQALVVVLKELLQLVERQEGPRAAEQVVPVKAPHTQEDLRDLRVSVQHALHPVELERWGAVAEAVWVQVDPSGKSSGGLMANDVPRPGMRTPSLRMEAVGLFRMHRIALHPSPSAADRAKLCLHYRTELPQTAGMEATPLSTAMQSTEHPYTRYAYTRRAVSALSVLEEHAVLARYACLLPLVPSVMMQSWIFFFFPDGLRPRSAPATRAALNTSNNEGILVGMLPPAAVQLLRIVEHLGDLSPILPGATHRSARAEKMYAVYVDGMRRGDADYSSIGLQMGNMFSSVAERSPVLQELYLMGECVREESFWEKRQDVVPKSFAHLRHLSPRCAMQMPATPHTSSTGGRTPLPIVTDPEVPSISRQLTPPLLRFLDRYLDESDAKSQAPSRSRRSGGGAESSVGAPSGRAAERSGRANNNNNNNGSSYASGAPVRASTPVTRPRSGVQAGEVLTPSHHNSRASRR